jgi:hypothetical protein
MAVVHIMRLPLLSLSFLLLASPVLAQDAPPQNGGRARDRGGERGSDRGGNRMFGPMGRSLDSVTEMREQFQPALGRRDVALIRDELGLDETQLTIVETLIDDYDTQFNEASDKAQQAQRDLMRQMFQSFMAGNAREQWQQSFQKIQADLEQMAVEAGGELPPETRRQYFREQMQKMSEEMQKEREASGAAAETRRIASEMVKAAEAWRRERTRLETQIMEGVRSSLQGDQPLRWEGFERFLRREKSLGRGRLSGESVNLFAVIDEAGLTPEQIEAIQPLLNDYEFRLDEALKRRNAFMAQNEVKALKAIQEGDAKSMEQLAERMIDLRNSVRNVHEEFRTLIVAALPPEDAQRVEKAALLAAYGRVYRPTRAERAFEVAMKLEDLTPDQRKAVEELVSLYGIEVQGLNQRIAASIRKSEPDRMKQEAVRASGLLNGASRFFDGPPEDPAEALFEKRGEMTDGYVKRLSAMLTPEQAAKLPQGTGRDDGRRQGPFGSWTIADMPEEVRAGAKTADKDGNGILEGDERREFMRGMRPPDAGGGQGEGGGQGREGRRRDGGGRTPPTS